MNRIDAHPARPDPDLNWAVDRFESEWSPEIDVRSYLPDTDSVKRAATLVELIRVDMELRSRRNLPWNLENYLRDYEVELAGCNGLQELCFEEYRLRIQNGDPVSPTEYATRFGVDTRGWESVGNSGNTDAASVANDHEFPRVGEAFHDCQLVGELGRGAFGRVYLARQNVLAGRFVVLKVTQINDAEPETLARLQHTNIVPVYSLRRDEKLQSICMPYLGIVTLADLLRAPNLGTSLAGDVISTVAGTKLETLRNSIPNTAVDSASPSGPAFAPPRSKDPLMECQRVGLHGYFELMMLQLAEALEYAHSHGVIHADIKPANILIGDDGIPLLLDFHLAGRQQATGSRSYVAGGTLPYMSISQLRYWQGLGELTHTADVFSLGVVMYQALTGRLPYPIRGSSDEDIERMIDDRRRPPVPLRRINPDISPTLAKIIEECLDEQGGYRNAAQLCRDLQLHRDDRPVQWAGNPSLSERFAKWRRRHPRICSALSVTALFVVLLLTLLGGIWNRLDHSARVEATLSSRQLQREIHRETLPITAGMEDPPILKAAIGDLDADLRNAIEGEDAERRRRFLGPDDLFRENRELQLATFWLARASYYLGLNAATETERNEALNNGLQAIDRLPPDAIGGANMLRRLRTEIESAIVRDEGGIGSQPLDLVDSADPDSREPDANSYLRQLTDAESRRWEGDTNSALQILRSMTSQFPDDPIVWLLKGHVHMQRGEPEMALACYDVVRGVAPDSPWGHYFAGRAFFEMNQLDEADRAFTESIERSPDSNTLLNRALVRQRMGSYQSAIDDINRAIDAGPVPARAWLIKSRLLRQIGEVERAEEARRKFMSLTPDDALSWNARGIEHVAEGELNAALHDFEQALRVDPQRAETLQNLAALKAEKLRQPERAIEPLTRLMEIDPQSASTVATRGVLFARLGRVPEALADARRAMQIDASADTLYRVAGIFALLSRQQRQAAESAMALLRRAAVLDGRRVLENMETDVDLDPIRDRDDFQALLDTLKSWSANPK